ncbi:MAG: AIM24 family protein, partial [Candidatus Anstonellales archaeon]
MEPRLNILKLSLGHVIKAFCSKGDVFYAKTGSIVSIKGETQIESVLHGGIIKSALRVFGGENVFINKVTCVSENAEVILGTLFPSEIVEIQVDGSLIIADSSYLAHTGNISLSADIGYLTSVFA